MTIKCYPHYWKFIFGNTVSLALYDQYFSSLYLFTFYLNQKCHVICFQSFTFWCYYYLETTLVMLKILQKYCCLNFSQEILHKNIFLLYLYSSWKTASCGLGYKHTGEIKTTWIEKTSNGHYVCNSLYTGYIHMTVWGSLYSWMCTVYILHEVNLFDGWFFVLNLFFFKPLSETKPNLWWHRKRVTTEFKSYPSSATAH